MENIWNKLKKGLKDYCSENGFNRVVLGLSGGLDSAMVSVLAAEVLGKENVKAIMMKTQFTSDLSIKIAREIAELNGFEYQELDIEPLVATKYYFLEDAFNKAPKNIVMQNVQARIRGQLLMAYSNQFGNLVLACGNKSEALMGYCTLYGDTCGGLAPIANIYKSKLFEMAKWLNSNKKVLPQEVISRAPTAELYDGQVDEDNLPSYDVLDKILELYVDEHKDKDFLLTQGFEEDVIEFVINQYNKMQFKQKQMPPALNI